MLAGDMVTSRAARRINENTHNHEWHNRVTNAPPRTCSGNRANEPRVQALVYRLPVNLQVQANKGVEVQKRNDIECDKCDSEDKAIQDGNKLVYMQRRPNSTRTLRDTKFAGTNSRGKARTISVKRNELLLLRVICKHQNCAAQN